jgi:hypothetical protein
MGVYGVAPTLQNEPPHVMPAGHPRPQISKQVRAASVVRHWCDSGHSPFSPQDVVQ